jgi:hypothetical protein
LAARFGAGVVLVFEAGADLVFGSFPPVPSWVSAPSSKSHHRQSRPRRSEPALDMSLWPRGLVHTQVSPAVVPRSVVPDPGTRAGNN